MGKDPVAAAWLTARSTSYNPFGHHCEVVTRHSSQPRQPINKAPPQQQHGTIAAGRITARASYRYLRANHLRRSSAIPHYKQEQFHEGLWLKLVFSTSLASSVQADTPVLYTANHFTIHWIHGKSDPLSLFINTIGPVNANMLRGVVFEPVRRDYIQNRWHGTVLDLVEISDDLGYADLWDMRTL
ncbi:hypothetical protein LTR56_015420 [Elasticomyces elasticus]|nr:hypothetical protein LTR22_026860 [Elasticomyces elasticus]KAK3634213.1 hypothetical protein LTR56_015420 [Elasticomyces elasticus]KAK4912699.1 hypothetical protein LTR49_018872 [Elasticomyces elasticus]KAK5761815.1 hypothetical protein LTS12_008070 [Elasticomyces elasticus]